MSDRVIFKDAATRIGTAFYGPHGITIESGAEIKGLYTDRHSKHEEWFPYAQIVRIEKRVNG